MPRIKRERLGDSWRFQRLVVSARLGLCSVWPLEVYWIETIEERVREVLLECTKIADGRVDA